MTTEEKARAYDDAIKKAESLYKASEPMSGCNVILETIFPELSESEDERIRKMCMEYLGRGYQHCSFADDRKNIEKCIAWLEKQGEQKSLDDVAKEVTKNKEIAISFLKSCGIMNANGELADEYKIEQNEQKPTDEEMKRLLQTEYEKGRADAIAEMQKDWSEEDINMIDWLIRCCEEEHKELCNDKYGHQDIVSDLKRDCRKKWDWLESLKNRVAPQNRWKPSERQLVCLQDAVEHFNLMGSPATTLNEILKQLRKLKEGKI